MKGKLIGRGRTAEVYAWGSDDARVLKLYNSGLPAGWVDYEAEIGRAVHACGVPSPALFEVIEIEGRRGIVYERVDGPAVLTVLRRQPWRARELGALMGETHARIHACQTDRLPTGHSRLKRSVEAADLPANVREAALRRLERLPQANHVCHGDFHPDNVVLTRRGPVVLDWTNAVRACPEADVARTLLMLRIGEPPPGLALRLALGVVRKLLIHAYLRRYQQLRALDMRHVREWMLPVAVARANESIPEERARLMQCIYAVHISYNAGP